MLFWIIECQFFSVRACFWAMWHRGQARHENTPTLQHSAKFFFFQFHIGLCRATDIIIRCILIHCYINYTWVIFLFAFSMSNASVLLVHRQMSVESFTNQHLFPKLQPTNKHSASAVVGPVPNPFIHWQEQDLAVAQDESGWNSSHQQMWNAHNVWALHSHYHLLCGHQPPGEGQSGTHS